MSLHVEMVNAPAGGQAGAARCCHRAKCFGLKVGLCGGLFKQDLCIGKRKGGLSRLDFFVFKSLNSTRLLFTITAWQIEETVGIQQITMLTLVFLLLWRIGQGEGFQP